MRVSTDGNTQLDRLMDTVASSISYTYDAYGWILPALLLTVLLFAVMALFCWMLEDVPLELEVFTAPHSIFTWVRNRWQANVNEKKG